MYIIGNDKQWFVLYFQIKKDFLQRFSREPPAKNTLLVWERKLFSSGSVYDAPRPGRPINRYVVRHEN